MNSCYYIGHINIIIIYKNRKQIYVTVFQRPTLSLWNKQSVFAAFPVRLVLCLMFLTSIHQVIPIKTNILVVFIVVCQVSVSPASRVLRWPRWASCVCHTRNRTPCWSCSFCLWQPSCVSGCKSLLLDILCVYQHLILLLCYTFPSILHQTVLCPAVWKRHPRVWSVSTAVLTLAWLLH